ncbi:MAG: CerR family C-terminal domain-containing protein [Formivibrio sp.]|nr:CerR family C-terminal domain-containing protein [Formivibrio sp.]
MQQLNINNDEILSRHALRSGQTCSRMIDAAIDVFGALGYEGASTRILADRAGVNLSAIPYHFGGKRELYMAAAQSIADYARKRVDPIIDALDDAGGSSPAARIDKALSRFFHFMVGGPEPEAWASFFVRCEYDGDDAFRMIHEELVSRFERVLSRTVAEAMGRDGRDKDLRMRVAVVLASIVNLRALRNMTLNSLGWDRFTPGRLAQLDRTIRQFAMSQLFSDPPRDSEIPADARPARPCSCRRGTNH